MTTAATLLYSSPAFVCSTAARRDALRVLLPSHALAGGVAIHTLNHAHMLAKDASADEAEDPQVWSRPAMCHYQRGMTPLF